LTPAKSNGARGRSTPVADVRRGGSGDDPNPFSRQVRPDELRLRLVVAEHMGDLLGHELRNVAVVLQAHTSLLEQSWEQLPPEQRTECIATISEQSNRLGRLVMDLLDLSRPSVDANPFVPVRAVVEEAVALTSSPKRSVDDTVEIRCADDVRVRANPSLIGVSVRNLVENALVHGSPPVVVVVWCERDQLIVRVDDHGPGVDPAFVPHLFEWSRQGRSDGAGFGLGLAIVHDVVALHGGRLTFASRRPQGASFRLQLPVGRAAVDSSKRALPD